MFKILNYRGDEGIDGVTEERKRINARHPLEYFHQ